MKGIVLLTLTAVLATFFGKTMSSFPNFLCPTLTNPKVFYDCTKDCQQTHGAQYGTCGDASKGDYNCYCGPVTKNKKTGLPPSVQCQERTEAWTRVCEKDCQCNHAGVGGMCLWREKVCRCWGKDPSNSECQFNTAADFAKWTMNVVGENSASGQVGKAYLEIYGSA